MKHACQILIISLIAGLLLGCASGRKALEKGNYEKALAQAINRLRSNDDHKKSKATLEKAYKYAVEYYLQEASRAKRSNDPFKWEISARSFERINYLNDEIIRCPGCRDVIPNPVRYDVELTDARQKAAEVRYNMGVEALQNKINRAKAIEAHQHFEIARNMVPRYKDVEDKLREAMYYATLKVVVEPIPTPSRVFILRHEFFVNKINEYLHNTLINKYVRFYTPSEVSAQNLEYVDHVVQMEFDQFALGNVFSNTTTTDVSRDSVLLETRDTIKIYGTVKAKFTVHEKAITGRGLLDFKILDTELNKVISQEKFPSEYTWAIQWATFNGDERALTEDQLDLVNRKELNIPNPQWMFEEFTAPIYDQVISKMTHFYRNY